MLRVFVLPVVCRSPSAEPQGTLWSGALCTAAAIEVLEPYRSGIKEPRALWREVRDQVLERVRRAAPLDAPPLGPPPTRPRIVMLVMNELSQDLESLGSPTPRVIATAEGVQVWVTHSWHPDALNHAVEFVVDQQQFHILGSAVSPPRIAQGSWNGRSYERNMDCVGTMRTDVAGLATEVFVVADGVGSSAHGDLVARSICERIPILGAALSQAPRDIWRIGRGQRDGWVRDRIGLWLDSVVEGLSQVLPIDGYGSPAQAPRAVDETLGCSTLVLAVRLGDELTVAWAGDSRAYVFRKGLLSCLTRDHNVAVREAGAEDQDAIDGISGGAAITSFVSPAGVPDLDFQSWLLETGDLAILCSDGLHGALRPQAYLEALVNVGLLSGFEGDSLMEYLVNAAWEHTSDNVSCVLAFYGDPETIAGPMTAPASVAAIRHVSEEAMEIINRWPTTPAVEQAAVPRLGPWPAEGALTGWGCVGCGSSGFGEFAIHEGECDNGKPVPALLLIDRFGRFALRPMESTPIVLADDLWGALAVEKEARSAGASIELELGKDRGWILHPGEMNGGAWIRYYGSADHQRLLSSGRLLRIGSSLLSVLIPLEASNEG